MITKYKCHVLLLIACLFLVSNSISAQESVDLDFRKPVADAINQNVHKELTWLRLLKYKTHPKIAKESDVLSPEFFLAYNENTSIKLVNKITPEEELIATIKAFYQALPRNENFHPKCRFPARYHWLSQQVDLSDTPQPTCDRLLKWARFESLESVSLLMVSGYFGNPASTFGHLLVKLNNSEFRKSSGYLLDQSINYGAEVPENEPIPIYIAKGLMGGYVSRFADKKYYTQDLVYSRSELRDIWEYELNLNEEENRFLVFHIWEMLGTKSTYYFLKENCGYRIAELLELITGENLTPDYQPWYLPLSVFQGLEEIEQEKYIKNIKFIPSTQRDLHYRFNSLSTKEANSLNQFFANSKVPDYSFLNEYSEERQSQLIDFMLKYYQYKIDQNSADTNSVTTYKTIKSKLLKKRFTLPVTKDNLKKIDALVSPAKGAKPRLINIGVSKKNSTDISYDLGIGLLHSDLLSNSKGTLENSELSALNFDITLDSNNSVEIRSFDILKIFKLGLLDTNLYAEKNKTWNIGIGFERTNLSCVECTNFYFQGGLGKTNKLNDKFISYAMLNSKYIQESTSIEVMPEFGFIYTQNDRWKSKLQTGFKVNTKTGQKDEYFNLQSRYLISRNNSLRISFEKFLGEEVKLSYYHNY